MYRRAANYVARILAGAKPGELPVELPTRYYLLCQPQDGQGADLTFPQSLLLRADEVVE